MFTSNNHSPSEDTEIDKNLLSLAMVLFLVLSFLLFDHALRPDNQQRSHGRTDAFPGWPPKLPPTQYASYPATWRAHQKSLHKSIQEHERCTGPWRPLYLLWEFAVSLVEWAVAGGLSLLELFMSVLLSICSRITPVVAITIFVLVLLAFALVVTLVTVITAEMMLARERQMQQHSQKRRLVIQLPNYSTNPRISTVKRRLLISPQAR